MRRYFISGGSSGVPKSVSYDPLGWKYIILDTASVLRVYGVTSESTVLIAHPSFPWDIGEVFAEASILCGADAVCYGLMAGEESLFSQWSSMRISHIFAPPHLLLSWAAMNVKPITGLKLIVAGDCLNASTERRIRELWQPADIRRIYGSSELGTLGYQFQPEANQLCMNPRFSYWLEGNKSPKMGDIGILVIAPKCGGEIIVTKDKVRVCDSDRGTPIWDKTFVMEFIGRNDRALTLSDGTTIHESVIASLLDKFRLERAQCIYKRDKDGEALILKYVCSDLSVNEGEIRKEFLNLVPELCDEFAESTYDVTLIRVGHSDLEMNGRGKVPLFIDKDSMG
jgi:acyl-CoA synthetase (AMP-forming)/AMP-acid ligase II